MYKAWISLAIAFNLLAAIMLDQDFDVWLVKAVFEACELSIEEAFSKLGTGHLFGLQEMEVEALYRIYLERKGLRAEKSSAKL